MHMYKSAKLTGERERERMCVCLEIQMRARASTQGALHLDQKTIMIT